MHILDLLEDCSDVPLIKSGDKLWTKAEFIRLVYQYVDSIEGMPAGDGYVLVAEESPVEFYALIFALWKLGRRVLFPNRDVLHDCSCFSYYEYSISIRNGVLKWDANLDYKSISGINHVLKGDTIVFSSGSTGHPKGIIHSKDSFLLNADGVLKLNPLQAGGSITFLKPYLVSAFSHFLVHFRGECWLWFLEMEHVSYLNSAYSSNPSLSLVGSPMHIISARKHIPYGATPQMFMSSGDFIYPAVIQKIIQDFPETTYYSAYGLAELAGRFFVNRIDSNTEPERYSCMGENLSIIEYRLADREIEVSSECLFMGYVKGGKVVQTNNFHASSDLVDHQGGCLRLIGRRDDELKVGGNKISLKFLEQKASSVFSDSITIFVPAAHDILGTLVAMVMQGERRYERSEIIARLRTVLNVYEMPHYIYMIDLIPYTQSMKIDRKYISDHLSDLQAIK